MFVYSLSTAHAWTQLIVSNKDMRDVAETHFSLFELGNLWTST